MIRRVLKGAVVPALILVGLVHAGSAAALDQDLVVSAASGAPGDRISVSSASCPSETEEAFSYVRALLITGTAPNELLAGIAYDYALFEGESFDTGIVVPDWVDPDAPAVIEASCVTMTVVDDEIVTTSEAFDPVAFDVLPGGGPGVQSVALSRTSLLSGQVFTASTTGCTIADPTFAGSDLFAVDDLSGRTLDEGVAYGEPDAIGEDFEVALLVSNAGLNLTIEFFDDGVSQTVDVTGEEVPNDLPAGTYTSVTYCGDDTDTLIFQPANLEVTGSAPTAEVDLTGTANTDAVTLAGEACTAGDVSASLSSLDLDQFTEDIASSPVEEIAAEGAAAAAASPLDARSSEALFAPAADLAPDDLRLTAGGVRALVDDGAVDVLVTPDASGAWSYDDATGFQRSIVFGDSYCGDPFEDGFVYDPQVLTVEVPPPPPEVTPTTPPPPANAVEGTPTYAG